MSDETVQSDPLLGRILKDTYRIDQMLADGGMSRIYIAEQLSLSRPVVVKMLLPSFHDDDFIQLFLREARICSQLNHPNIVSVLDFGHTEDGLVYLIMEYLEGASLADIVHKQHGLPLANVVWLMEPLCNAINAAHQHNVVHRDLKPGNVMVANRSGNETTVKVVDFGISKPMDEENLKHTQLGTVMGTPGYLAPEQIRGTNINHLADVYGIGAILHFMITGEAPYRGASREIIMNRQMKELPPPLSGYPLKHSACEILQPVIYKAMAIEPEQRYQSVSEMWREFSVCARQSAELKQQGDIEVSADVFQFVFRGQVKPGQNSDQVKTLLRYSVFDLLMYGAGLAKEQRGVHQEQLRLGMSAAFSGSARELGRGMRIGMQAYFKQLNDSGGINGRLIDLYSLDDGYEPKQAQANMSKWLDAEEGVFALIGNVGTPTSKAILPQTLDNQMLLFGAFSGADLLRKDPPDRYVLNYRASYAEETSAIVHYFVKVLGMNPKQIAVFYQNDSFGFDGLSGVANAVAQYGVSIDDLHTATYLRNSAKVIDAIALLRPYIHDVQGIVIVGAYPASARFTKLMKMNGYQGRVANVSFVGAAALLEELKESGLETGEGVVVSQVVPMYDSHATGVLEYQQAMNQYFPSEPHGFVSLEGYVVAKLMSRALKQVGRYFTTEEVVNALEQFQNVDLGVGKPLSFSRSDHQASHQVWGSVINGAGEFEGLDFEKIHVQ